MVPGFKTTDSTVIVHREYIQDIVSGAGTPSAFTINSFPLNPGQPSTFPWLAQIAANYEEYDILGMVFEFISTSGESVASTNTSLGTVIMATEYDPTKPAFASKQAMENYSFAVSCKPSCSMLHAVECKKARTPVAQLYVRTGANTGSDLRWTDFGNFYIATVGMPAAGTFLGELFVTFKVRLLKPRLPITLGFGGQIASNHTSRSGAVSASPLGTTTVVTFGPMPLIVTGTTLTWSAEPQTRWLVTVSCLAGTSISTLTATASGAVSNLLFQGSAAGSQIAGGTQTLIVYQSSWLATSTTSTANVVLTFAPNTIVGAANVDIVVTQLDTTVSN
jgi:hypothetical protein